MRVSLFLFLLILISCNQRQDKGSSSDTTGNVKPIDIGTSDESLSQITCWGIGEIELGDDFAGIEQKVGKDNISLDSLILEGTFKGLYSTLWKGTAKEIEVHWKESKPPFKTINYLEISQKQSPYAFTNGIKIGTSLKEIEKLNGKPINIHGFGWDYGGSFADFGSGKLQGDIPCFAGVFNLVGDVAEDQSKEILGEQVISSDNPAFKELEAKLVRIRIDNK